MVVIKVKLSLTYITLREAKVINGITHKTKYIQRLHGIYMTHTFVF